MSSTEEQRAQRALAEEPIGQTDDAAAAKPNKDRISDDDSEREEVHAAVHTIDARGQKPLSELKRFAMLTAAVFAMICGSTSYAYNIISGDIQKQYDLKFRDMSNISTVGMVFCYFLLPYGTLLDLFGPRIIYTIGCVLFPLGALLFGLTFQGVISGSVVRFCVYNAMLSLGSQLFDLASVVVMLSVFPTRKGWVIALLKTMMGLGQAVIACIKTGFFAKHAANYFYFLIALVVVIGVAVQLLVKLPPYHLTNWELKHMPAEKQEKRLATRAVYLTQEPPMWRFYFGIGIILALVVYLPMTSAIGAFCKDKISSNAAQTFAIVAVVLTCCLLLMMVPFPLLDRLTTKKPKHLDDDEKADEPIAAIEEGAEAPSPKSTNIETDIDYIAPQYQTTFLQSCCTLKLWCILWTMFCGVGAEFVIIFNAKYIYAALNKGPVDDTVAALLTVLNGAGSAFGRLLMCWLESYTQRRKAENRIPITASFFVPTSCIIVSIVLFLVLPGRSLLLAYTVAALGNGFCASVTILVLRTIYAKDPAKHYNFGYNALWIAAILLNRLLFGEWYAVQADREHSVQCYKKRCVLMPLVVMLGLNCSAFLSDVYLHITYSRYCRKVLAERRRMKEAAAMAEPDNNNNNENNENDNENNNNSSSNNGNSLEKAGAVSLADIVESTPENALRDELTSDSDSNGKK